MAVSATLMDYQLLTVDFTCSCGIESATLIKPATVVQCACGAIWTLSMAITTSPGGDPGQAIGVGNLLADYAPDDEIVVDHGFEDTLEAPPSAPGDILDAFIRNAHLTHESVAEHLFVTPERLEKVITGKSKITLELAAKLGRLFGNPAHFWANLQTSWDLIPELEDPKVLKVERLHPAPPEEA